MTWIAPVLVAVILFAALFYIVRAKRKGKRCIGCPYAGACAKGCCSATPPMPPDKEGTEENLHK